MNFPIRGAISTPSGIPLTQRWRRATLAGLFVVERGVTSPTARSVKTLSGRARLGARRKREDDPRSRPSIGLSGKATWRTPEAPAIVDAWEIRGKYSQVPTQFYKGLADIPCYISSDTIETRSKPCNNLKGVL